MSVHPSVTRGFGRAAESYERSRPGYPADAVAWLVERIRLVPGTTVIDLAAGTGKLTRLLVRVLRPDRKLVLLWNMRDQSDDLQRAFTEIVEPLRDDEPSAYDGRWRRVLAASPLFGPLEERAFYYEQWLDADGLAERASSISFVSAASDKRRADVVARVRALAGEGFVRFPYVTAAYVTERVEA